MGAQLRIVEQGFHRRQSHDLTKLLRALSKESDNVVEILLKLMTSESDKIKMAAVAKFFDIQYEVAEAINRDQMQRLLANAKYAGPKQLGVDEDDDTPQIDFSEIQKV